MAEYKNYGRAGGFQKRSFSGSSSHQKELYDAECSKCSKRCQVPFRPNGKKPVYCSNCFTKGDGQSDPRSDSGRREYAPRVARTVPAPLPDRQLLELNTQIKIMNETLEKLVIAVDTFNRATALTNEIRKHFPANEPVVTKKAASVPKKVASKSAAAPKKASKK